MTDELYHHGIKGQKWGIRRYQNEDGSLTPAGKKRQANAVASDKNATIVKGTKLYRVSTNANSDASDGKIYVSATKKSGDFYVTQLGLNKIRNTGKAYVQEYMAKTDLKLPDKKTMEKIELGLLKDPAVQRELVDSLMKKGMSREQATAYVKPYNAGKAFAEKAIVTMTGITVGSIYGGILGTWTGNPIGVIGGAAAGAAIGGIGTAVNNESSERSRALNAARVSYGDVNNKVINETLKNKLKEKGYNAMKDYNDRRAFGKQGEHAVIVFDSKDNVKFSKSTQIKSKEFAEAYARSYLKEHPNSKLEFNDLLKDGAAIYKQQYEAGVIDRERAKENKRLLKRGTKSNL